MNSFSIISLDPLYVDFLNKSLPTLATDEALIKISCSALNRRDFWITVGKYPGLKQGVTLGSDGCGYVVKVGSSADQSWLNKRVVFNPNINWGSNENAQSPEYHVLGMPSDGTFADYIVLPVAQLAEPPSFLSDEECASFPLAGLTAYRALSTKGKCEKHYKVLVTGIGGGVAQFVMQFALSIGAEVFVTSSKLSKTQAAIAMGASAGFDYKDQNWKKTAESTASGFDIIVDSTGGETLNDLTSLCKPGGRIVCYGATLGRAHYVDLAKVFWKQIQILGSTMGSDSEFKKMLAFIDLHKIVPNIDSVRPFKEIKAALQLMEYGNQTGKIVLKHQPN